MTDITLDTISVRLQRDAEGQFLNIPLEFELATNDVLLTKNGDRQIIETAEVTNEVNVAALEQKFVNAQSGKGTF